MLRLLRVAEGPNEPSFHRRIRRARSTAQVSLAIAAFCWCPGPMAAHAQSPYTHLYVLGDSYADNGNVQNIPFTNGTYPSIGQSPSNSAAAHAFVAYPVWLQSLLGLSNDQVSNYAIGGSTSQELNVAGIPFSFPFQLAAISGRRFSPTDLVTISIGGNDALQASGSLLKEYGYGPDGTAFNASQATNLANQSTNNLSSAVKQLVGAGARNIVLAGFSSQSRLPIAQAAPYPGSLDVYAQTYYSGIQTTLAPLAQSGVRIFLFDEARMTLQVGTNLGLYGFQSYASNPGVPSLFQPDGVHFTSAGFLLEARYMANLVNAPNTVAAQANLGQIAVKGASDNTLRRLDANRDITPAAEGTLSLYASGDYFSGDVNNRYSADGFSYRASGPTIGAEYVFASNLLGGLSLNYFNPTANLNQQNGHIDLNAYQLMVYASLNYQSWYADLVLGYGYDDYRIERPGIIDTIDGRFGGNSYSASLRGGHMVDLAPFKIGPVIGLGYANSGIDHYSETGDPLLTFSVSQSNLERLTGSAGLQVRALPEIGEAKLNAYLSVTAEHDFLSGKRTLLSVESQAQGLPIYTTAPGFGDISYGKIAGGVTARLGGQLFGSLTSSGTFGGETKNDFSVGGQLALVF